MSRINVDALHSEDGGSSNIELDDSRNTTCKGNLTVDGNISVTGTGLTDTLSFRNLIYNGDCRIAQRGTSSTSNGFNTIDRWKTYTTSHSVTTVTASQQSLSSSDTGPWAKGFRKYSRIALSGAGTAAAGTQMFTYQPLESQDIANSGWDYTSSSSYLQLSFWVRSSTAQAFPIGLYTKDGTEKLYTTTYTVSSANTWEKKTIQIPGATGLQFDDNNGEGIRIYLACPYHGTDYTSAASDATWVDYAATKKFVAVPSTWLTAGASTLDFTGVQLEVGSSATEFEHRTYGEELARCQRYFYMHCDGSRHNEESIGVMSSYGTNNWYCFCPFPVTMREGTPSLYKVMDTSYIALMSGAGDQDMCGDVSTTAQESANGYMVKFTNNVSNTTGHAGWAYIANSSARIGFDAEF